MHDRLVALVTGANKGIGLQIAQELMARAFTVRLALLDANGPTGTFSNEDGPVPW
jgi:NAD(P)-dependent dehydrogenase (short-subunit alcohol dehydrogenase family)